MRNALFLLVALLTLSQSAFGLSDPKRTIHVDYRVEVWGPGTLDLGNCPTSVDFTLNDYTHKPYSHYTVGYGEVKCDIKVSGRAYQMTISPGIIDFRATVDYPEGYKEFIQYVILKPTDPDEFGLDLMSYAEFPADRAFAHMSQTGEIYKFESGKRKQIDRLRFHFTLTDPQ